MAIKNLNELCDALGPVFVACGHKAPTAQDVLAHLAELENERVHVLNASLAGMNGNPFKEQKALYDDRGRLFGRVTAEIPEDLFFNLTTAKRMGGKGLAPAEAIQAAQEIFPQCKVKTIFKPRFSGFSFQRSRRSGRVTFGRGTMKFAE